MSNRTDFGKALTVLHTGGVEFIIVGGVAAILNGLGYTTYDLDVVYSRERANIENLSVVWSRIHPICGELLQACHLNSMREQFGWG